MPVDTPTTDTIDLGTPADDTTKVEDKVDERTDDEKAADEAKAALFGAPEEGAAYEISGLPEGVEIDKTALDALDPIARELGLSSAGASKLAQVYAEQLPRVLDEHNANMQTQILDTRKAWETETLDAIAGKTELKSATGNKIDFGGKSVKQVQADAARAIDRLAPPGFRDFLAETGLGQHPAMVALCYQAGLSLKEDTDFEASGTAPPASTNTAKSGGMSPTKFFDR